MVPRSQGGICQDDYVWKSGYLTKKEQAEKKRGGISEFDSEMEMDYVSFCCGTWEGKLCRCISGEIERKIDWGKLRGCMCRRGEGLRRKGKGYKRGGLKRQSDLTRLWKKPKISQISTASQTPISLIQTAKQNKAIYLEHWNRNQTKTLNKLNCYLALKTRIRISWISCDWPRYEAETSPYQVQTRWPQPKHWKK